MWTQGAFSAELEGADLDDSDQEGNASQDLKKTHHGEIRFFTASVLYPHTKFHWPSQEPIEDGGTDSIYVWPIS